MVQETNITTIKNFNSELLNWLIFIFLALIWGSSFKLMKIGMEELSSYQVASLRILSAGVLFLPITIKNFRNYDLKTIFLIICSGLAGNFIPAYLFCMSETKIDSSLAGIINSAMPIFVIILGLLFFNLKVNNKKILGVTISFIGLSLLLISKVTIDLSSSFFLFLAILATILYAINSNLIAKVLKNIKSMDIISISMSLLAIPAFLVLFFTNYFTRISLDKNFLVSTGASVFLGMFGTAIASGVFYVLIKRTSSVFAASVTNVMPIVAILWGILSGENITLLQIFYFSIIMTGVYITSK